MEKLYASKAKFLKMAGGRMHAPHPTPLYPPLAISYRTSKEPGIYQSLGTINFVLFLLKGRVKKGGGHGPIAHRHISDVTNTQLARINDTVHLR